jgi:hypothetical protein
MCHKISQFSRVIDEGHSFGRCGGPSSSLTTACRDLRGVHGETASLSPATTPGLNIYTIFLKQMHFYLI